jgi:hypothetical protein
MAHLAACRRTWSPTPALTLAVVLLVWTACIADPGQEGEFDEPPPGATRGHLVVYVADLGDGRSEELHFLQVGRDERDQRRLLFDRDPELASGAMLDVWGVPEGDALRVTRFERVSSAGSALESTQQSLLDGAPFRARRLAFVFVDVGGGINLTKETAERRLFGMGATDASVRQYYVEASYGRQDLGGQILGPFKYTMEGCDFRGLATTLRPRVPEGFDHYLWYMGSRVSACTWTGLATAGSPARPTRDTFYNGSSNCVVLVQEPGHNFGMKHSSSMRCGRASFHDTPRGNCTHTEYGDPFDPMGRGCRHMNGYHKAYQGWFGGCNVVDATSSGTFTLVPIELACDGIQMLQIPMPKARPFYREGGGAPATTVNLTHYYVELRAPHGFDRTLTPQVQIRVSGDIRLRTQGGINTWLLDMNPATTTVFEGLGAEGSFTDPDGSIKITVQSVSATQATVRVDIRGGIGGAPTCLDGTPLKLPGPGPESCAASPSRPNASPVPTSDGGVRDSGSDRLASDAGGSAPVDAYKSSGQDAQEPGLVNGPADAGPASGAGGSGGSSVTGSAGGGSGAADAAAQVGNDSATKDKLNGTVGCGCRIGGRGPEAEGDARAAALLGLFVLWGLHRLRPGARGRPGSPA